MVKDDSEPMALEFIKALDRYSIPFQHYRELYDRSIDLRSRRLGQGLPCDDFSADLMIACWQGLKADLKQREIDAGRTLTGHAQSQCPKCLGTGMERLTDSQGRVVVRAGCQHEFTEDEQDAMDGLSMLEEALKRPERSETASQVITRLRRAVAFDFINAEHDTDRANSAWEAQKILLHAANYVKGLEGA